MLHEGRHQANDIRRSEQVMPLKELNQIAIDAKLST